MEKKNPEVESKIKIILVVFAVLLAIIVAVLVINGKNGGKTANTEQTKSEQTKSEQTKSEQTKSEQTKSEQTGTGQADAKQADPEQENVYTPTFMYFVTKNDEGYDEYMKTVKEVEEEYGDKVQFEITDIDEESEAKENFGDILSLGTPTLIMLNTKNEPCAFVGKCVEKKQMTDSIESALGTE